ncbi:hypothetical protein N665_0246s0009 [Sinapis alba]|nr:hypothetical protein N665_0246s0009 [Sinapis alba]
MLADCNHSEQYYTNISSIRPPTFQRTDFELKSAYFILVGQTLYHGHPHEHPMDHLERFKDLVYAIKANGVPEDYLFCRIFKYSLSGNASYYLKQLPPGSLTSWTDIKTPSCVISLMMRDLRT